MDRPVKRFLWIAVTVAVMAGVGAAAQQSSGGLTSTVTPKGEPVGTEEWSKLIAANNLTAPGKAPFHLGMTFQLYDLAGGPAGVGSFETWWSGPGKARTVVHLTGLNEDGSAPEGADAAVKRAAYLVRQLVEFEISPVPTVMPVSELNTTSRNVGKTRLDCIGRKPGQIGDSVVQVALACVTPNSTQVLMLKDAGDLLTLMRPQTGTFRNTHVAFESRIRYLGKDAVVAKLGTLQADPSAEVDTEAIAVPSGPVRLELTSGEVGKHRINFVAPSYPQEAIINRLSGAVLLDAILGVDGHVRALVPIACTNLIFVPSATQAVKQWTYTPFMENGVPREVETIIAVHYEMNGG